LKALKQKEKKAFEAISYPSSIVKGMQFDLFQFVLRDQHQYNRQTFPCQTRIPLDSTHSL
jgi:hypothetical protein